MGWVISDNVRQWQGREFRDRRTLARLARTCRYFLEPALNVLYYEINDLLCLIKCMPDDLWVVNGKQLPLGHLEQSLKRPMTQSDWDIFLRYTRRVRSLEFDRHCYGTTHVSVLLHLRCGEYRPEAVSFLQGLLQPTLVHVDIDNLMHNALTNYILPLLPFRCPRIKQFMASATSSLQRAIRFPVLREALLSAPTMSHALRFLKFIQSTSVDTINLNVDDETCAADYKVIFTSWAANPSYRNLSVIDISEMRIWRDYDEKHIIDIATLRPLFQLKRLTCLKLETLCYEIAAAWPLLETLDLSIRECGWELPPKLTLQGLIPLLRGCPNLALLGVVVDARILPPPSARLPGAGVRNMSLESLWLADSVITRPSLVAAFLSAVAPNVEQIVSWNTPLLSGKSGKDKYRKKWREVERLVRQFSAVRRQEREWAGRRCGDADAEGGGDGEEDQALAWDSEPDPPTDSEDDDDIEYCYGLGI
ncbi:hypothetical protein BU15DRAFT_62634 [Melanogaster broomeanus]|nr:hypothetical protein BU15DRAFT_62634 [Melanogaster broomeanus]